MQIQELMTTDVRTVKPNASLHELARTMREADIGALPVVEKDKLVGMVTDRDIVVRGLAKQADLAGSTARDVMSSGMYYCFQDQSVEEVLENMGDVQLRRLAVVDRDKSLVGMVSIGDLAKAGPAGKTAKALSGITREGKSA
jgi:CBS domain-containing protein